MTLRGFWNIAIVHSVYLISVPYLCWNESWLLQGKEAEMFMAYAKKYDRPNALNAVFESRVKDIDQHNYFALTSLYLEVFNPARAGQAEKMMSRYKVCRASHVQ